MSYTDVNSIYYCDGNVVSDGENKQKVTEVYGDHETGKDNSDVQGLVISGRNIEYFPTNIDSFFPNITVLDFSHNSIFYVSNQHLIPFASLELLNLYNNKINSLDSNLLYGLDAIKSISFWKNDLKHVGHDFIIPANVEIFFNSNPCIDRQALTPDQITALKFSLLVNCPPSISQIEDTLESRSNLLKTVNGQVQSLGNRTDFIEQNQYELDNEVKILNNEVTDLHQINLELTNKVRELQTKNSQLELRQGFLNTRTGQLEARVAVLEATIISKLGLKIDEAISDNENQ